MSLRAFRPHVFSIEMGKLLSEIILVRAPLIKLSLDLPGTEMRSTYEIGRKHFDRTFSIEKNVIQIDYPPHRCMKVNPWTAMRVVHLDDRPFSSDLDADSADGLPIIFPSTGTVGHLLNRKKNA